MIINLPPRGFLIFFLTEMWERYGFYILQSLLVFYALQKLELNDTDSYAMVGSFTALAYINSIFGGIIADKFFGYNKAVISGALALCGGYLLLSLATTLNLFALGLAIITVGTGLLKPNISSMLSILYHDQPQRKEAGYTLFYVGIYFGAISGSFLGGFIKKYCGWPATFASAAIGLGIALLIFKLGTTKYKIQDKRVRHNTFRNNLMVGLIIIALSGGAFIGIRHTMIANWLFAVIGILSIAYLLRNIFIYQQQRKKLIVFSILVVFSILYWAIYFQQFFSLSLCAARVTQLTLPASSLTAFESLGVILFGPLVYFFWQRLQQNNKDLSLPAKFSISFLLNGLSFLLLVAGLHYSILHNIQLNQILIIGSYLLIALGELFISPIGLAMVSTLVPPQLNGAMMGIFLMSIGFGGKLAGIMAMAAKNDNGVFDLITMETIYRNSFALYAIFSLIIFLISIVSIKPLNRLLGATNGN